jgi:hypothetical protein
MPAAIPLAVAGITMVANNVSQKNAIKNNEVQQASAVGNAKDATNNAFAELDKFNTANPAPFGKAAVNGPGTPKLAPSIGSNINAASLLGGKGAAPSTGGNTGSGADIMQFIQMIMALAAQQQGTGGKAAAPTTPSAPSTPSTPSTPTTPTTPPPPAISKRFGDVNNDPYATVGPHGGPNRFAPLSAQDIMTMIPGLGKGPVAA